MKLLILILLLLLTPLWAKEKVVDKVAMLPIAVGNSMGDDGGFTLQLSTGMQYFHRLDPEEKGLYIAPNGGYTYFDKTHLAHLGTRIGHQWWISPLYISSSYIAGTREGEFRQGVRAGIGAAAFSLVGFDINYQHYFTKNVDDNIQLLFYIDLLSPVWRVF